MVKSTGVIRSIDVLGRLVMPAELRRQLNLNEGDPVEFYVEGDQVILKKYLPGCIFCGNTTDLIQYMHKPVCAQCRRQLIQELKEDA